MTLWPIMMFYRTISIEGVQPLEGGAFRLKFRRDRRSGMKIESRWVFYPRYGWETIRKLWSYLRIYRELKSILDEVLAAPDRWSYSDVAIAPPQQDEFDRLSLYHDTTGGEAALARKRRGDVIRAGGHVHEAVPLTDAPAAAAVAQ